MWGNLYTFNGLVIAQLVCNGVDEKLKDKGNTFLNVYSAMLIQICRDYSGLSDFRTLTMSEIRFFYDGLRGELKEHTKPK